jgi:uncharacterized protein (DUF1015 family)
LAKIFPFQPYRYSAQAGDLNRLITQPYDKITPAMQARYLSLSPYNLVRVILGERKPEDSDADNVYTRAANYLNRWIEQGILVQDESPGMYAYFQEFTTPGGDERLVRKSFIALGAVEDYGQGSVHRHEQTLSGPKQDRLELLRRTRAHCELIFMLYPDRERAVDAILDEVAQGEADGAVTDEYGASHKIWRIADAERVRQMQQILSDKKLLIADGHHRYETALAFRNENPGLADARKVPVALVNMYSEGLRILATHRVLSGLPDFNLDRVLAALTPRYRVARFEEDAEALRALEQIDPRRIRIGVAGQGAPGICVIERERAAGELDVRALHEEILRDALGISDEAVRNEKHLRYVRGLEPAIAEVRSGAAQAAFLLQPASIEQVAEVSFGGGVMPQKSTDFYPKLLSGFTIYRVEK